MNIILIGFMGSGKSTIAQELSESMNLKAIDTDVMIEEKAQTTINNIFDTYGEEYFRDLETALIEELSQSAKDMVISVGGGLPVREINRKHLKATGKVVYLRATVDTLYGRLQNDTTRPLLRADNLRERIENLISRREKIYEEAADVIIDTDDLTVKDVVNVIEKLINEKNS